MYTIRLNKGEDIAQGMIQMLLEDRLAKSPFRVTLTRTMDKFGKYCIEVKPVRLRRAKPYCGAHPDVCENPSHPKPNATFLEWNDWVRFHKLVNTTLNKLRVDADVWSNPPDVKGKMWIRKGLKARKKYEWTTDYINGRRVQTWNAGTDDQF